jgi:hypothetical protein
MLGNSEISVNEIEDKHYLQPGIPNELKSGNGVFVNLAY